MPIVIASWNPPMTVRNHGIVFVSRYCSSSCITAAPHACSGFESSTGSIVTTSGFEKNASAAVASFFRTTLRVFGRKIRERYLYESLMYFESRGCFDWNIRRLSSHDLR
jgi:hypothetical protein